MKLFAAVFVVLVVSASTLPSAAREAPSPDEGRGCCSHHKGVCGCKSGQTTCCDGTISPSCLCVAPDE